MGSTPISFRMIIAALRLDNAKEDIVVTGSLKHDVKPETVAIKRQCRGNILHDEEWCDAGNFCFSHVSFLLLNLVKCQIVFRITKKGLKKFLKSGIRSSSVGITTPVYLDSPLFVLRSKPPFQKFLLILCDRLANLSIRIIHTQGEQISFRVYCLV